MTNPTPPPNQDAQPAKEALPSPLRCFSGALISGGFAIALYFLTSSIAQTYADKPIASTNQTAIQIAIAVRTLVVGLATLATTVFGVIAFGLVIVTIYVLVQQLKNRNASSSDAE
ncbi:MAG: DUF3082 domain-containing protein [Coleofasciculus sp. S288]|nr:DUF3082 domain-containing protein [Coleofasciculus sp. S288]